MPCGRRSSALSDVGVLPEENMAKLIRYVLKLLLSKLVILTGWFKPLDWVNEVGPLLVHNRAQSMRPRNLASLFGRRSDFTLLAK